MLLSRAMDFRSHQIVAATTPICDLKLSCCVAGAHAAAGSIEGLTQHPRPGVLRGKKGREGERETGRRKGEREGGPLRLTRARRYLADAAAVRRRPAEYETSVSCRAAVGAGAVVHLASPSGSRHASAGSKHPT